MASLEFPNLSRKPDGETYGVSSPNPSKEGNDTDGGYWMTRPKYTRKPPRSFKFKFTDLSQADHDALLDFWETKAKGSSVAFLWRNPADKKQYNVRFGKGMSLTLDRTGYGPINRYDSGEITLTEV